MSRTGTDPGGGADRDDDPDPRWAGHRDLRRTFLGFEIGVLGVALAFGLSLLCAAYLFGHISGCHINPAVTIGMWALKRTPTARTCPSYLVGQILGAALGAFIIWAILETGDNIGTAGRSSRARRCSQLRRTASPTTRRRTSRSGRW